MQKYMTKKSKDMLSFAKKSSISCMKEEAYSTCGQPLK